MKRLLIATTTAVLALSPTLALAHPGSSPMGHSGMMGPPSSVSSSAHSSASSTSPSSSKTPPGSANPSGQPNQSCQTIGFETPGNAADAPGSAFNPNGNAGTNYAGQQPQNSKNSKSVAQYDVACSHQK